MTEGEAEVDRNGGISFHAAALRWALAPSRGSRVAGNFQQLLEGPEPKPLWLVALHIPSAILAKAHSRL